jgi:microsomal dipeptidase-like Zn-dependent dipeptidase
LSPGVGDDYAAYYVRELPGGEVVWVAENGLWGGQGGYAQPAFTHVFFGKKSGPSISGQWIDLPKGKSSGNGALTFTIKGDQDMDAIAHTGAVYVGKLWRSLPNSLRGYADLHTHPMVNLGFGGKLVQGGPDIGSLLPADSDCNHNVRAKSIEQALGKDNPTHGGTNLADVFGGKNNPCGDNFRQLFIDVFQQVNHAAYTPDNALGYPSFKDWPRWNDISHQKMWVDWVRRSYDAGQRVLVALAVNNATLAAVASGPGDGPTDDRNSADLQIAEIKKFIGRHNDFMEVAYNSKDLRRIVAANKMAIILGVEVDNIGNLNKFPVQPVPPALIAAEIRRLYDSGVRYIFPVHVLDNPIGHTAVYEDHFNYSNRRESGDWWHLVCSEYDEEITYDFKPFIGDDVPEEVKKLASSLSGNVKVNLDLNAPKPPDCKYGMKNSGKLTADGIFAINEMMKLGMLIDIDHMSQASANQTLGLAEAVFNKYPLVSGHNNVRSLATQLPPNEKLNRQLVQPNENTRTDEQLTRIGKLGGMFGLGSDGVDADDWAKRYVAASMLVGRGRVSFGTDLNGLVKGLPPYNGVNIYTPVFPMSKTGDRLFDYRKDGVAHYGMLADFLRDISLKEKNGEYVRGNIMNNAEYFAKMWEKAETNSKNVK